MKIEYSKYQLEFLGNNRVREGALLKVRFSDDETGFSDIHPWSEFGADPIDDQLKLLAQGYHTELTTLAIDFARLDAKARFAKQSLFEHLEVPSSHILIADIDAVDMDKAIVFNEKFKIKMGNNLHKERAFLKKWKSKLISHHCKFSIDFNLKISQEQFNTFLKQNTDLFSLIDFIEDPFTYEPESWKTIRKKYSIALASDFDSSKALDFPDSCDVLVVKPAIQKIKPFITDKSRGRSLMITSCLDHPIGQLSAAYIAAMIAKINTVMLKPCGLLTHYCYKPTPFSERLHVKEKSLYPSENSYGWGFDDLLENLEWRKLT